MDKLKQKCLKIWPAITQPKYPTCRAGKIYASPLHSLGGQNMLKTRPNCGMTWERSPNFYDAIDAINVSYALVAVELMALAIGASILTDTNNPWLYYILQYYYQW